MNKKGMLREMIDFYTKGNKAKFAHKLGVTPQAINSWEKRDTFDIDLIFAKCEGISARWLLSGEGDMLSGGAAVVADEPQSKQQTSDNIVDRLISMLSEKDATIKQMAERIGILTERLTHMDRSA